jgi:predicted component of type VI protein secretion system
MDKIADNQSWSQDKTQRHQSEEVPEEVNALSTKMDDLLSWLAKRAKYKEDQRGQLKQLIKIQALLSKRFHINQNKAGSNRNKTTIKVRIQVISQNSLL